MNFRTGDLRLCRTHRSRRKEKQKDLPPSPFPRAAAVSFAVLRAGHEGRLGEARESERGDDGTAAPHRGIGSEGPALMLGTVTSHFPQIFPAGGTQAHAARAVRALCSLRGSGRRSPRSSWTPHTPPAVPWPQRDRTIGARARPKALAGAGRPRSMWAAG